jgi:hypothetical protein
MSWDATVEVLRVLDRAACARGGSAS